MYVSREATFALTTPVQVWAFQKNELFGFPGAEFGPHLWFTGHNELLIKSLKEESPQTPLFEM